MSLLNRKAEFWGKFEGAIFEVLIKAVDILNTKETLPENEDELNRCFYFCLVEANYNLQKINKGLQACPFYEGNNQPRSADIFKASRENKRPDFQWSITDIYETDPQKSSKQFVLECKRLGKAKSSWVFNANYINNGIARFISNVYGYGVDAKSAAMLGYIQDMTHEDILDEINLNLSNIGQNSISLYKEELGYYLHTHQVNTNINKSIRLEHIWIDLKRYYN